MSPRCCARSASARARRRCWRSARCSSRPAQSGPTPPPDRMTRRRRRRRYRPADGTGAAGDRADAPGVPPGRGPPLRPPARAVRADAGVADRLPDRLGADRSRCTGRWRRAARCWPGSVALALLWLLRLAHYLRFRRNPDADDATLHALAPQLARAGAVRRRRCGRSRSGCSGTWARRTTRPALILVVYSLLRGFGAAAGDAAAGVHRLHLPGAGAGRSCASPATPASRGTGSWPAS